MNSLSSADLAVIDALVDFARGRGYVLDFSDRTFAAFFSSELGVDIDEPRFADMGGSKGKRLRRYLQLTNDAAASQALTALWEHRTAYLSLTGITDPVPGAERRFQELIGKLGGGREKAPPTPQPPVDAYERLRGEITAMSSLSPQARGYAFERFLADLFELHGLDPRKSFRNKGEQIDGSFVLGGNSYLLEAKWQTALVGAAQLRAFEGNLGEKAPWARGLFLSYVGFSQDGLAAFGRAKRTLCMDGYDLFEMLNRGLTLGKVLDTKARRAAETGLPFAPVRELF
jgi:hypothetical protein